MPDLFGHIGNDPYTQFVIPHTFYFSENTLAHLLKNCAFLIVDQFDSSPDEIALIVRKTNQKKDEQKDQQRTTNEQNESGREFQKARQYLQINGTLAKRRSKLLLIRSMRYLIRHLLSDRQYNAVVEKYHIIKEQINLIIK